MAKGQWKIQFPQESRDDGGSAGVPVEFSFSSTSIHPEEQQHRWVSGPGSGESLEEPEQLIFLLLLNRGGPKTPSDVFKNHCITSSITNHGLWVSEAAEKTKETVPQYEVISAWGKIQEKDCRSSDLEQKFGRGFLKNPIPAQREVMRKCCSPWTAEGGRVCLNIW